MYNSLEDKIALFTMLTGSFALSWFMVSLNALSTVAMV